MDRYQRVPVPREPEEHAENEVGEGGAGAVRGKSHRAEPADWMIRLTLLLQPSG